MTWTKNPDDRELALMAENFELRSEIEALTAELSWYKGNY